MVQRTRDALPKSKSPKQAGAVHAQKPNFKVTRCDF